MTVTWIEAQESFSNKEECIRIGRLLEALEKSAAQPELVRTSRTLQVFLGVIVDQLVKGKTDYTAPSLFQRIALHTFVTEHRLQGHTLAEAIEEACAGLDKRERANFVEHWARVRNVFVLTTSDVDLLTNIIEKGGRVIK